jgi:hypothetical protein
VEACAHGEELFLERPAWITHLAKFFAPNLLGVLVVHAQCARMIRLTSVYLARSNHNDASMMQILQEFHQKPDPPRGWYEQLERTIVPGVPRTIIPNAVWAARIIHNRSFIALQPWSRISASKEEETQVLAEKLMVWDTKMRLESNSYQPSFAICVAKSVWDSKSDWSAAIDGDYDFIDSKGCLKVAIFEQWRDMMCGLELAKRCVQYL